MSTSRTVNGVEVASHYKDEKHQYASNKEGIWLFMVTEILMFGGLFVGYILFHSIYPEMFAEGAQFLDWRLGL
jgi:cytochrome c oxidase subunit III